MQVAAQKYCLVSAGITMNSNIAQATDMVLKVPGACFVSYVGFLAITVPGLVSGLAIAWDAGSAINLLSSSAVFEFQIGTLINATNYATPGGGALSSAGPGCTGDVGVSVRGILQFGGPGADTLPLIWAQVALDAGNPLGLSAGSWVEYAIL